MRQCALFVASTVETVEKSGAVHVHVRLLASDKLSLLAGH